ncbi:MAG: ATP-binding protein, partial [Thermoguttaceae bacterium]|nr:ATP-binding protein [Thermoguttaceae bacterium]
RKHLHLDHIIEVGGLRALKFIAMYGANASGKTNFVDFFRFFKTTLINGLPADAERFFCKNRRENEKRGSLFEIQFEVKGKFYAYGFEVILAERKILHEWLYELFVDKEPLIVFERKIDNLRNVVETSLSLPPDEDVRFKTYSNDFAETFDSLFLAEMNHNKIFGGTSSFKVFNETFQWLLKNIVVFSPNESVVDLRVYYDESAKSIINEILPTFDAGATEILVKDVSLAEFKRAVPEEILNDFLEKARKEMKLLKASAVNCSVRSGNNLFNFKVNNSNSEPQDLTTLVFKHGKSFFELPFKDESDGTKRLFDLFGVLFSGSGDAVFIFDELDRSLHPMITRRFLELFNERYRDKNVQLLFTTHEAELMTYDLFRRDEIWFVERGADNGSFVYPLSLFKNLSSENVVADYLDGRFGAVPVLKKYSFKSREEDGSN